MKIFVISHKPISIDLGDPFVPLYVGQIANTTSGLNDRTGDSIAQKNPFYSELTAQYWVWKNILPTADANEIIGFCHYRRFFSFGLPVNDLTDIPRINHSERISRLLQHDADVLLSTESTFPLKQHWFSKSKKLKRLKFPWQSLTLLEQFELEHNKQDLLLAAQLLPEQHKQDFIDYLNGHHVSLYNMYAAKPLVLQTYFATLFPWLFEVEKHLDFMGREPYQARLPGFIAERFSSYYFNKLHRPALTEVSLIK